MSDNLYETLFLRGIIEYPDKFFLFVDHLSEDDFSKSICQDVFACVKSLYLDREVKKITRSKLMAESRRKNLSIRSDLIGKFFELHVGENELGQYFQDIKKNYVCRTYNEVNKNLAAYFKSTQDSAGDIISRVEHEVFQVGNGVDNGHNSIESLSENAEEVIRKMADNPGQIGIDIGLPTWLHHIGQLRNGGVTFVAARAKAGKSQFAMSNLAHAGIKLNLPVLYCDSELDRDEQIVRLVGITSGVPYEVLENGYWKLSADELKGLGFSQEDIDQHLEYGRRINNSPYWDRIKKSRIDFLSIAGLEMDQIIPKMRRWVLSRVKPDPESKAGQCLIVFDYLKLNSFAELRGGRLGEHQVHAFNVIALNNFARTYNVPILAFGQTNREMTNDFRSIAGSDRIMHNVVSVSLLKEKDSEEIMMDPVGDHYLSVLCARFGAKTGGHHINLSFDKSKGALTELGLASISFDAEKARKLEEYKNKKRSKRRKNDDDDDI